MLLLAIVVGSVYLGVRISREEAAIAFAKRYLHTLESIQEFYSHTIFEPRAGEGSPLAETAYAPDPSLHTHSGG